MTENRTSQLQGKIHSIQLLRAAAAMLVVLFHSQQAFAGRYAQPAFDIESYLFAFGAVGVHIFFVISGFIMVYTAHFAGGFDVRAFYRRRLMRIYPIYWICIALYFAAYLLIGAPLQISSAELVGALLLLPGNAAAIIGPAWTLAFEMFFYLCFGLAMIRGLTRGIVVLTTSFLALITLGQIVQIEQPVWDLVTDSLLIEFIAGAGIGWLLVKGRMPHRGGILVITAAFLLFGLGIAYGYDELPSVVVWGPPSTLLVAGAVMYEAERGVGPLVKRLGHFGDSSYALYLIHIMVIALFIALAHTVPLLTKIEPGLMSIPIAIVAVMLAELLHHRVERPLLKRLNPHRSLIPLGDKASTSAKSG